RGRAAVPWAAATAPDASRTRPRLSPRAALASVVATKVVVTLAPDSRYGWHRDELYYVATGRHLAFGYVDFPSVTPVLARVSHALFGDSLVGLRVLPLIAGVGVVALTVLMARELGGGPRAQLVAGDRKSTRLNSSHEWISYAVFCLKKKKQ